LNKLEKAAITAALPLEGGPLAAVLDFNHEAHSAAVRQI